MSDHRTAGIADTPTRALQPQAKILISITEKIFVKSAEQKKISFVTKKLAVAATPNDLK